MGRISHAPPPVSAYRGVAIASLTWLLGNAWLAVLVSAVAFALAHSTQGWKSSLIVFAVALSMHALVTFTGTLVIAMVIHTVFDLIAGYLPSQRAASDEREAAASASWLPHRDRARRTPCGGGRGAGATDPDGVPCPQKSSRR